MCSFDRGFHSRNNRIRLDDRLELNALPGKGRRNRAAREREAAEEFAAMRRQHPAVESAINALEHRGLDRVRTHGTEGFARMVALSVLAGNLHRLGRLLRQQEQDARKRRRGADGSRVLHESIAKSLKGNPIEGLEHKYSSQPGSCAVEGHVFSPSGG